MQVRGEPCLSQEATHATKVSRLIIERLARQRRMKKGSEKGMGRHTHTRPLCHCAMPPFCVDADSQSLSQNTWLEVPRKLKWSFLFLSQLPLPWLHRASTACKTE